MLVVDVEEPPLPSAAATPAAIPTGTINGAKFVTPAVPTVGNPRFDALEAFAALRLTQACFATFAGFAHASIQSCSAKFTGSPQLYDVWAVAAEAPTVIAVASANILMDIISLQKIQGLVNTLVITIKPRAGAHGSNARKKLDIMPVRFALSRVVLTKIGWCVNPFVIGTVASKVHGI